MSRRVLGAALGAATLAGTVLLAPLPGPLATAGSTGPTPWLPACAAEDGPGPCFWDAATRGNGRGNDAVIGPDDTIYTAVPKPPAGFKRWPRPIDGHSPCYVKVGPTSRVWCTDGYRTTS